MKKVIYLLTICLSLTSCVLHKSEMPNRTAGNIESSALNFMHLSVSNTATVMDNCILSNDFLNASPDERKAAKYTPVSFSPATNTITLSSGYIIETQGKFFTTPSVEWIVTQGNIQYSAICTGEKQWTVSGKFTDSDSVWSGIKFSSVYTLTGKDSDDLCTWQCRTNGSYKESDKYSAKFQSDNDINVKWMKTYYASSSIYWRQVYSGKFAATFFIDGKEYDWCVLTIENGSINKTETSLD